MMNYQLADHIHFCLSNGQVTFLDLRADRYFAVPQGTDLAFQRLVNGDPISDCDAGALAPLLSTGVLQPARSNVPLRLPPSISPGERTIIPTGFKGSEIRASALASQVETALRLRLHPLSGTITRLQNRKHKAHRPPQSNIAEKAMAFLAIRRVISTQDHCLNWSIALIDYLAKGGHYPTLVVGVRRKPFAAHAWVQADDLLLNDIPDRVARYSPILAV